MIIETGFTDRYHSWALRQFTQRRNHVVAGFFDIARMHADDGKNVWILLGELDRTLATFDGDADGQDPGHSGIRCALQDIIEIRRKIRVIEVRVSL